MTTQPHRNRRRFYGYPRHRMVAIVDDDAGLQAALSRLREIGLDADAVDILSGPDGARLLDRKGQRHGFLGRLLRLAQWTTSENDVLDLHQEALQEGRHVVYVPARGEERKERTAAALRAAGAHHLVYFGRWSMEKRWL